MTRLNLEAAVVCLISMGECVTETAAVDQEEQMREGIAKLQGIMEVVSAKISIYLTFLAMMVISYCISLDFKFRNYCLLGLQHTNSKHRVGSCSFNMIWRMRLLNSRLI